MTGALLALFAPKVHQKCTSAFPGFWKFGKKLWPDPVAGSWISSRRCRAGRRKRKGRGILRSRPWTITPHSDRRRGPGHLSLLKICFVAWLFSCPKRCLHLASVSAPGLRRAVTCPLLCPFTHSSAKPAQEDLAKSHLPKNNYGQHRSQDVSVGAQVLAVHPIRTEPDRLHPMRVGSGLLPPPGRRTEIPPRTLVPICIAVGTRRSAVKAGSLHALPEVIQVSFAAEEHCGMLLGQPLPSPLGSPRASWIATAHIVAARPSSGRQSLEAPFQSPVKAIHGLSGCRESASRTTGVQTRPLHRKVAEARVHAP